MSVYQFLNFFSSRQIPYIFNTSLSNDLSTNYLHSSSIGYYFNNFSISLLSFRQDLSDYYFASFDRIMVYQKAYKPILSFYNFTSQIAYIKPQSPYNIASTKAIYGLRLYDSMLCARSYNFPLHVAGFWILLSLFSYNYFSYFAISVSICSILHGMLKSMLIFRSFRTSPIPFFVLDQLPTVGILVPLYMEPNIGFIIKSISRLQYPAHLLAVKLVIEEDDMLTLKELALLNLPKHFDVIKVPESMPRTKPKALNYAAQNIDADYIGIFDAEDMPDPLQLIKAYGYFSHLDDSYVCLQAKLNYYNAEENFLTIMQSIEYEILFNYLLPGLANSGNFIPLGGTSCYFKTQALRKLGFWDAFNVTEDMDLGIRIYLKGYKTSVFDSTTLEEAILSIFPWLQQRTRWIKGFIQSYIVFCYNRNRFNLKIYQSLVIDIMVGIGVLNFLIPIYFIIFQAQILWLQILIYSTSIFGITYLMLSAMMIVYKRKFLAKQNWIKKIQIIILFPCYFILHTIASYLALLQLITAPFKWNKTLHGISKFIKI